MQSPLDPIPFFPLPVTKSQETQREAGVLLLQAESSVIERAETIKPARLFLSRIHFPVSQLLTAGVVRPAHGAYLSAPAALGACRWHPSPAPLLQHQGG